MANMSKKPPKSTAVDANVVTPFLIEDIGGPMDQMTPSPEHITHVPNLDMFSSPKELVVEVELPGVQKNDIELTLYKSTLTIKAVKFECFEEEKINYVCMERTFGRLFRTIEIPFPVDTARVRAVYRDGILTVKIPRVEDKRCSSKRVPIESR